MSDYQGLKEENNYLNSNVEILKKQIEPIKEERRKDKEYYETEQEKFNYIAVRAETEPTPASRSKDEEILLWNKKYNKLNSKLVKMGIIKDK